LSPLDPNTRGFTSSLADAHLAAGRYEEAIEWADRSLAAQLGYRHGLRINAICCAYLGRVDQASYWVSRLLEIEPGLTIAAFKASLPHPPELLARHAEGLRKAGLAEE
jgi:adenylate cyclase